MSLLVSHDLNMIIIIDIISSYIIWQRNKRK